MNKEISVNVKQIIERFKSDMAFAKKYSALKSVEAVLEQAKADGFEVTTEDIRATISQLGKQSCELSEDDLAVVTGGTTKNRHNIETCSGKNRRDGACLDPLLGVLCDHYRKEDMGETFTSRFGVSHAAFRHSCGWGYFSYTACTDSEFFPAT